MLVLHGCACLRLTEIHAAAGAPSLPFHSQGGPELWPAAGAQPGAAVHARATHQPVSMADRLEPQSAHPIPSVRALQGLKHGVLCLCLWRRHSSLVAADVHTTAGPLSFRHGFHLLPPQLRPVHWPSGSLLQLDGPRHNVDPHGTCRVVLCVLGYQQDGWRVGAWGAG
jgi:hypothetical protein